MTRSHISAALLLFTLLAGATGSAYETDIAGSFYSERLIFDQIPGRPQSHASTITELPGGDLLEAWYAGTAEKAKDVAVMSARFSVADNKWSQPRILNDAPGLSEGNPVLYTGEKGRVWFFYMVMYGDTWNDCRIHYRYSDSAGIAWSDEKTLVSRKGYAIRNRPITLGSGTMILPAANEMLYTPLFILTKDNFKTIRKSGQNLRDEGGLDQPAIVELPDKSVLAYYRSTQSKGIIMKTVSQDGGLTWTDPEETEFPNPESGIAMTALDNGNLALVYNNSARHRYPLTIALSRDNGKTWPWRRDIETDPHEFSYPCVIQSGDGLIHVTYTWKRTHIKHVVLNKSWIMEQ